LDRRRRSARQRATERWRPWSGRHARARAALRRHAVDRAPAGGRVRSARPTPAGCCLHVIRVLLVDDEALVREGLRLILETQSDIEIVGEAGDGNDALRQARELAPDVVLMDVRMP